MYHRRSIEAFLVAGVLFFWVICGIKKSKPRDFAGWATDIKTAR
jgi:hypothetical protein